MGVGRVGRPLHFLLVGIATPAKISLAFRRLGAVTVVTSQPLVKALRGSLVRPDLSYGPAPRTTPRERLAGVNVERYLRFCDRQAAAAGRTGRIDRSWTRASRSSRSA